MSVQVIDSLVLNCAVRSSKEDFILVERGTLGYWFTQVEAGRKTLVFINPAQAADLVEFLS